MLKFILVSILIFFLQINSIAQHNPIDSLQNAIYLAKPDTNKVNALLALGKIYSHTKPDTAILLCGQATKLAQKLLQSSSKKNKKRVLYLEATSYNICGLSHWAMGNFELAVKNYLKALKINTKIGNKTGMAICHGNIGNTYSVQANYQKALTHYFKALKIDESIKNKIGISVRCLNIGTLYMQQNDFDNALNYLFKALKMTETMGNKSGSSRALGNIGIVYSKTNQHKLALTFYLRGLVLAEELGDKYAIAALSANIGTNYKNQGDSSVKAGNPNYAKINRYPKALKYFLTANEFANEMGDQIGLSNTLGCLGLLSLKTGNFINAEKYINQSLKIATNIGALDYIEQGYQNLSSLYDTTGKLKLALVYYKKYIEIRDSIANEANTKKQTQLEMQYAFDKTHAADSIRNAERAKQETLKHNQEIKQQKIYTYGGIVGFGLMLVVAFVSFRAFKNKQKANHIIAEQKHIVEEKQKEIIDSIRYAKRIQLALLPSEKYIAKQLARYGECKPRD